MYTMGTQKKPPKQMLLMMNEKQSRSNNQNICLSGPMTIQGSHRLEKYLNLEGFLQKSLKIKIAFKSTGN